MVQHIWIKTLQSHKEFKWNFADIYNLLTMEDISEHKLLSKINIYGDTVIKKVELNDFIIELQQCNIQYNIDNVIKFIKKSEWDIILIWD